MKKFLPILLLFLSLGFLLPQKPANAQVTPSPGQQMQQDGQVPSGSWVLDPEVTFIGKNAARSGNLLDFILRNYNWVCVKQAANGVCDNSNNPLLSVWQTTVVFIISPLLILVVLIASIIIIVTRGRSITIMRFFPRFIGVLLLIALSFAVLQFIYQFIDGITGFFLRREIKLFGTPFGGISCPPECISQKDLLYVGWDYRNFIGLRLLGDQYAESAFISLLLTKLTALTYYVMVGVLIIRKIILWLFIIVSPIFPILLLFYPVRNTGKIWIGEFFRWLLYAPLFAIFLNGLVALWRNQIPLVFSNPDIGNASKIIYPTAVNILLGGPKQYVTPTNSVNLTETFGLYVVSLLMLWGVIILPWILLQIFLDYASNIGVGDSPIMKTLVNRINNLQGPPGSHPPAGNGAAINLPFAKKFNLPVPPSTPTGMARDIPVSTSKVSQATYMPSAQVKAQTLSLTNLSIPSLRDVAKYDTSLISNDKDRQKETIMIRENLQKIGNPSSITSTTEKEHFTEVREKLTQESKSGNTLATSILNAANVANKRSIQASTNQIKSVLTQIANPSSVATSATSSTSIGATTINKEKVAHMNESLVKAKREGNALAASILSVNERTSTAEIEKLQEKILDAKAKGEPIAQQIAEMTDKQRAALPVVNRVQTVSKEDYQAVKDMWKENYRNLEVPEGMAGTRSEWIKADMTKIQEIIQMLSSQDETQVNQGMQEVSSILPFLLVGGFSQAEILSYLKAKQEAAKEVATEMVQDEDDKVTVDIKKTTAASGHLAATLPEDSGDSDDAGDSGLTNLSSRTESKTANVSDELLTLTNLKLPKLTDIVQYEVRHLTKDKTESERIEKMQQVLERISNPENITSAPEREQYEKLREKLAEESQKGNPTADVILSAISQLARTAAEIDLTLSEVKVVLTQIVDPSTVVSNDDRDYYTRLHEYLEKESKEKNNTLAAKILTVNSATSSSEIQEIKEKLMGTVEGGAPVLPQLTSAVADITKVTKLRSAVKDILTASDMSTQDNQVYSTLHETLKTKSLAGNSLAASLMSITDKTTDVELKKVYKDLTSASQNGDTTAAAILSQISTVSGEPISLKNVNTEDTKAIYSQIAHPESVESVDERKYFSDIHDVLEKESRENNNTIAQKILTVSQATSTPEIQQINNQLSNSLPGSAQVLPAVTKAVTDYVQVKNLKEVTSKINSASNSSTISEKKDLAKLRESLTAEKAKGNPLAAAVLSINASTPEVTLRQIHQDLTKASQKGDPLAKSILAKVTKPLAFSSANRLQEVKPEDYQEAKELWKKAYKQYFVPPGFTEDLKGRTEWINKDIADIESTITLLSSQDPDKRNEGTKKVSSILPFLLLGGFSFNEMLTYLRTKLDAAREALKELQEEEENSVAVPIKKEEEKPQEMKATPEENNEETKK